MKGMGGTAKHADVVLRLAAVLTSTEFRKRPKQSLLTIRRTKLIIDHQFHSLASVAFRPAEGRTFGNTRIHNGKMKITLVLISALNLAQLISVAFHPPSIRRRQQQRQKCPSSSTGIDSSNPSPLFGSTHLNAFQYNETILDASSTPLILPASRVCGVCQQQKERALFPRKEYLLGNDQPPPTCTHCRKTRQANRVRVPPPRPILQGRKAESGVTRKPNNFGYCTYIDKLFGLDCFEKIIACGAFTTAKDVSESMAALQAATYHGKIGDAKNVFCLAIGDGSTPRSAVLVAFLKGWRSISIDPALKKEWEGDHATVRGLYGFSGTLEDFLSSTAGSDDPRPDHVVLLCVHSHARFVGPASISNIQARYHHVPMTIVSLPCCAKFRHVGDIGRPPDVQYDDDCVFSACRTVEVWNVPNGEN